MPFDPDHLLNYPFPPVRQNYAERDCILYALGIGLGVDPLDENCLRFVYEDGLKVLPSQAVMLAHPGFWAKQDDIKLNWVQVLHTEQEIIWHQPLPPAATVEATTRITDVIDKGARMGALIISERTVRDIDRDRDICTLITTILARGEGGFDGSSKGSRNTDRKTRIRNDSIPNREPDFVCDLVTLPQQALVYRLSGDQNPLHASPEVARSAGFEAPILHGLCTLGVATHALLKTCCDYQPERFKRMRLRFSSPVYPGETIRTEIWQQDNMQEINFRCKSVEQNKVVINNGFLKID